MMKVIGDNCWLYKGLTISLTSDGEYEVLYSYFISIDEAKAFIDSVS